MLLSLFQDSIFHRQQQPQLWYRELQMEKILHPDLLMPFTCSSDSSVICDYNYKGNNFPTVKSYLSTFKLSDCTHIRIHFVLGNGF